MKIYRTTRTAMRALLRNPMRALLTTLGIVIGVGSVIAMMAVETPYAENNTVNARWFPARGRRAVIVLPQWNADALSPSRPAMPPMTLTRVVPVGTTIFELLVSDCSTAWRRLSSWALPLK